MALLIHHARSLKLLSSNLNACFLCFKCRDKITKLKVKDNNRKSRNSLITKSRDTPTSVDGQPEPLINNVHVNCKNQNVNCADLMTYLNDKFDK